MPSCPDCKWLLDSATCGIGHPHPLRNYVTAIVLEHADLLQPGYQVLEVGCGAWSPLGKRAEESGCRWQGINLDSSHMGRPTIATTVASVEAIPFPSKTFDLVVATQSMEHWEEYRVDLRKGLSEVFRVLRSSGWALANVPIFYHGGHRFVLGDLQGIRQLFEPFADEILIEPWRHPPTPLPPVRHHLRYYWHKPSLWNRSGYVLDIRAKRKASVPYFHYGPISTWRKVSIGLWYRGLPHYVTLVAYKIWARLVP